MNQASVFLFLWLLSRIAFAEPWDFRDRISDPAWVWSVPQVFDLSGTRMRVQHFTTPLRIVPAARELTQLLIPTFSRVQVSGSEIRLSGMSGPVHWLARLRRRDEATVGEVSSLELHGLPRGAFDASHFVPSGAQQVVRVGFPEQKGPSLSHWQVTGRTEEILAHVGRRLRSSAWRAAGRPPEALLPSNWRHPDGAQLSVFHESRGDGVLLTFWHEKEVS